MSQEVQRLTSGHALEGPARGAFAFSGVVTLLTDFGLTDPFVGLVKVAILGRCPGARIVDLCHLLPPFSPAAGAFWLERASRSCPPGTVHVAVVDPGVGTGRRLLAGIAAGQAFLGPDNGLLGAILTPDDPVRVIDPARYGAFGLGPPSATFHGRDVLGPLAGELAAGRLALADLGPPAGTWVPSPVPRPVERAGRWEGAVILVDHYGNAFTNLPSELLAGRPAAALSVAGRRVPVVGTYGEAVPGTAVAVANSFGVLEIAIVTGDAGRELGLVPGTPVGLEPG
jgi:S-adenosylmethionine hydrolase